MPENDSDLSVRLKGLLLCENGNTFSDSLIYVKDKISDDGIGTSKGHCTKNEVFHYGFPLQFSCVVIVSGE